VKHEISQPVAIDILERRHGFAFSLQPNRRLREGDARRLHAVASKSPELRIATGTLPCDFRLMLFGTLPGLMSITTGRPLHFPCRRRGRQLESPKRRARD